jgi:hypothetical protein
VPAGILSGICDVDGQFQQHVAVATAEVAVGFYRDDDIEVARWATVSTGLTFAGQTYAHAIVHARGYLDRKGTRNLHHFVTMALAARRGNDFAFTPTAWAGGDVDKRAEAWAGGDVDKRAENRLLNLSHLTGAVALGAAHGLGARFGTRALAAGAGLMAQNLNLLFAAKGCLFEGNLETVLQVCTPAGSPPRATSRAHAKAREEIFKDVFKTKATKTGIAGAGRALYASVTKAVIGGALLLVAQHLIGLADLFEALLGAGGFIHVRVILAG